jgi:rRNA maturation protein Nop10
VLCLLVERYSNGKIVNRLAIRKQTVKDHVSACSENFMRAAASRWQSRRPIRFSSEDPYGRRGSGIRQRGD